MASSAQCLKQPLIYPDRGLLRILGEEMPVGVQGHADVGVTCLALDNLDIDSLLNEQGHEAVPQVMEATPG